MLPPTTCWAPESTGIKFISTSIKLADLFLEKWFFGCFWIRSGIRAFYKLSETEQLFKLDLSQYIIILLALPQLKL